MDAGSIVAGIGGLAVAAAGFGITLLVIRREQLKSQHEQNLGMLKDIEETAGTLEKVVVILERLREDTSRWNEVKDSVGTLREAVQAVGQKMDLLKQAVEYSLRRDK